MTVTTDGPFRVVGARTSANPDLSGTEDCLLRAAVASNLDRTTGDQLRLWPVDAPEKAAAYTIQQTFETTTRDPPADIVLPSAECDRLADDQPFEAGLAATVPDPGRSYVDAWKHDGICETVWDDGSADLLVCAPHAGDIEANTGRIAATIRKRLGADRASAWFVHGFGPDAFDRYHITTNDMTPASYPGLARFADRPFRLVVSVHVWSGDEVLIGGLARDSLRERIAQRIHAAIEGDRPVVTDYETGKYMAATQNNLVNWLSADGTTGVQLECPPYIVNRYRRPVARAVADVCADALH